MTLSEIKIGGEFLTLLGANIFSFPSIIHQNICSIDKAQESWYDICVRSGWGTQPEISGKGR